MHAIFTWLFYSLYNGYYIFQCAHVFQIIILLLNEACIYLIKDTVKIVKYYYNLK